MEMGNVPLALRMHRRLSAVSLAEADISAGEEPDIFYPGLLPLDMSRRRSLRHVDRQLQLWQLGRGPVPSIMRNIRLDVQECVPWPYEVLLRSREHEGIIRRIEMIVFKSDIWTRPNA